MRRDICLIYQKSVKEVFDAYILAIRDRFDKECDAKPYYALTFGLNFSFKYNMNGGACTVHFMSLEQGTAVNVRYSVAQGVGARYEAHNRDLTKVVESRLGCSAQAADIDVEEFLKPENQTVYDSAYKIRSGQPTVNSQEPVPWAQVTPVPISNTGSVSTQNIYSAQLEMNNKKCSGCGNSLSHGARFCTFCGKQVATQRFCSQCGRPINENDRFCASCGTKLLLSNII